MRDFLEHLYKNGNPDNRYLIYGHVQHFEDLHMLDQAIFAYRRLICALDDRVIPEHFPNAPTFSHRDQMKKNPTYFSYVGSSLPLDRLIKGGENAPLRQVLLDLNFAFAENGYLHPPMWATSSSHNSSLIRNIFEPLASNDLCAVGRGVEIGEWILKSIRLPADVKNEIRDEIDAARRRHPSLP